MSRGWRTDERILTPRAGYHSAVNSGARSAAKPHVLYVCWGFPPSRGSGVFRGLATANALAAEGFRVTVITADRETFIRHTGVDLALEERVDASIQIIRVPFEWPTKAQELGEWTPERAEDPAAWMEAWNEACLATFPEPRYGAWAPRIVEAAEQLHARQPINLVVTTANPNVAGLVGAHLYEQYGIPHVLDQRDAWTLNVLTDEIDFPEGTPVAQMEARLVASASELWYVNQPIRDWYAATYPASADRMHVVMNGYDASFAPAARLTPSDPERPLVFGYVGTISSAVPLAETLDAWLTAREISPEIAQASAEFWGHLGFFVDPLEITRKLLASAAPYGVDYRGPVSKVDVPATYSTFDVLLFLAGRGKYVTSGKILEYMATGLPIVSVHEPDIAATSVLRDYPLWHPVADMAPDTVSEALVAAAHSARTASPETRRACVAHAAKYARTEQFREPLARIHALLGDKGGPGSQQSPGSERQGGAA